MQLNLRSSTQVKKIPKPPALPFIGNLLFIGNHQYLSFTKMAKQYGDIFQIHIFSQPIVVINGLETIKQALLKQADEFAGRPHFYTLVTAVKGRTIGGRDYGLLWKRQREITNNALHLFVASKTIPIEEVVMEEVDTLTSILAENLNRVFDPKVEIGLSVGNVMVHILFGEKYDRDDKDFLYFVNYARDFTDNSAGNLIADFLPQVRKFPDQGLEKRQNVLDALERLILKKYHPHRASYNPEKMRGMVDALIKAVNEVDEEERETLGLTENVIAEGQPLEMMGTGLQPIAPLISWAILYMIVYPEIQAEVHQELDRVIAKTEKISFEDRTKLPFVEACIHELLRHIPHFPAGIPHATTNDVTLNDYFIPKQTPIFVNFYSLTRDEKYWEEPEVFNPHRFLNENHEVRQDLLDKYYPFGLGKRRCLGEHLGRLEIFLFFANLMHKFKFEKVPGEKLSLQGTAGAHVLPQDYEVIIRSR
jgi:cytochrome P450